MLNPKITQDQLSGRLANLGVSLDRAAVAKIEIGLRSVFDFELPALANALKVDVRWLLGLQK
jgi:transcriptional regulator with XRE-family HTH domain